MLSNQVACARPDFPFPCENFRQAPWLPRGDRWYDATGWCAYSTREDTRADALATCLYEAARFHLPGHRLRAD